MFFIFYNCKNGDKGYLDEIKDFHSKTKNNKLIIIFLDDLVSLSPTEMSYFYKTSKIFMHACEEEGECRAIQEALSSGCVILAKEIMKGGYTSCNKENQTREAYNQCLSQARAQNVVNELKKLLPDVEGDILDDYD